MEPYKHWKTPRIWTGRTAFIIGGGPSILDIDLGLLKTKRVIGCNDAYLLGSFVDLCYFGDWEWFKLHWKRQVIRLDGSTHKGLKCFKGLRVTSNSNLAKIKAPSIKVMARASDFCTIPGMVFWGSNTGVSSINLAYNLGCRRMVLLGFDMQRVNNKTNWHDPLRVPASYPYDEGRPMGNSWLSSFTKIKNASESMNFEVYNASPISKLDHFEKIKYEDAIDAFN